MVASGVVSKDGIGISLAKDDLRAETLKRSKNDK